MTSHRQAAFVVRLLDVQDREIRVLDGVTGGSVQLSATTRLRASGELTIRATGEQIDWLSQRVRIDYEPEGMQGWPLGVFLFGAPKESASDEGRSWQVELLGKLAILDSASTEETLTIPAGANLVATAKNLIEAAGEDRLAVTASSAVSRSAMVWEPGTSVLTVVNDLLSAAGYWSAWADGAGVVQLQPYQRPAARPRVFEFVEGDQAVHSADWTRDQDLASVPNKVVLVGQGSDDMPALVGVATNEDPASPLSRQRRGRWITHAETGVEAADQETITALARRKLIDASTPHATLIVSHMPMPLMPNDVGRFTSQGTDASVVLQSVSYRLDPTELCQSNLQEVVDL